MEEAIQKAAERFKEILRDQLKRVEKLRTPPQGVDFAKARPIVIGVCPGDGIGPVITGETVRVLESLLRAEIAEGSVVLASIAGLTLENRLAACQAIPDAVLEELHKCHVILKGPTTTPDRTLARANIESANVAMRRELDLFANVRPVKVPGLGIDWIFFRENTEGAYILGSRGVQVTDELSVDFTAVTSHGCERIFRMAFDYARKHGVDKVIGVSKANVIKTTDGLFVTIGQKIAQEYPGIRFESWYADIVAAKLIDPKRRSEFKVLVLPNLYGDILTDEAAEIQGGVGTAGSGNIGTVHAMFEAIHGSAPRMVQEGRAEFADPSSMLRAAGMLLRHIGMDAAAERLDMALDLCIQFERRLVITGMPGGATAAAFASYILATIGDGNLRGKWVDAVAAQLAEKQEARKR